jgi:hypothetical protein
MAKPYNFMAKAEYTFYVYGITIKPHCGIVETTWKVPAKYQALAEDFVRTHFSTATHPSVKMDVMGNVTFTRQIDFTGIFDRVEGLPALAKYNRIMEDRDEAINDACYRLVQSKESFQDMIRGKFYTGRFIDNAPSIP